VNKQTFSLARPTDFWTLLANLDSPIVDILVLDWPECWERDKDMDSHKTCLRMHAHKYRI